MVANPGHPFPILTREMHINQQAEKKCQSSKGEERQGVNHTRRQMWIPSMPPNVGSQSCLNANDNVEDVHRNMQKHNHMLHPRDRWAEIYLVSTNNFF